MSGRFSNCSIIEALDLVEDIHKNKNKIYKTNRVGDHKWYITNNNKFKRLPNWKQNMIQN